jgi:outer membrane protein, heavy metal efflux system
MARRWSIGAGIALLLSVSGCARQATRPDYAEVVGNLHSVALRPPESITPDEPAALALDPPPTPAGLLGPQSVDAFIRRALAENREVQAAHHEVDVLAHRIPQATALDDPMFMSSLFPVPAIAPQYSIMGYMPFMYTLTQTYPWFGTRRLRGQVADQEVKMALARLAAVRLETIADGQRAYFDLYLNQRAEEILVENRKIAADIAADVRARQPAGGRLQDVYRAEVAEAEIDRELVSVRQALSDARAELAQQLHVSPEADLRTLSAVATPQVPEAADRLYRLAVASRPELKERLDAVARDEREVELARKRYYPNITVGLEHWKMSSHGALSPTASGTDNFGMVIGFNLPVYRKKLDAGLCEAESRAVADARRYDAERDRAYRQVKELLVQAKAQRDLIELLETTIQPKTNKALELAWEGYRQNELDYVTLNTARLELLQIQLQLARLQAEQGKAVASLERAVGVELTEHPATPISDEMRIPAPDVPEPASPLPNLLPPAPEPAEPGPFRPADES